MREVHARHSAGGPGVPWARLAEALGEVGVEMEPEAIGGPPDGRGAVDLSQFERLARDLRGSNEWAGLLPLHEVLADALPRRAGQHPLRVLSGLSPGEVTDVCQAFLHGLDALLRALAGELRAAFEQTDALPPGGAEARFSAPPGAGAPREEVGGLLADLAKLQLRAERAPPGAIFDGMREEHRRDARPLPASAGRSTTPEAEWRAAVGSGPRTDDAERGRRMPSLEALMESDEAKGLRREEVVSLVLYTGHMVRHPPAPRPSLTLSCLHP